jgi:hypothetical protein
MKILGKSIPEILLEVIIVVFGILIAFLLDNWWNGVQESREHKDILSSLEQEFSENQQFLKEEKKWIGRAKESALNILLLDPETIEEVTEDKVDSLLYWMLGIPSFSPNNAVVQDIINSGKIKYLGNNNLEREISSWGAEIKLKNDLELEAAGRTEDIILNYLYDRISFLKLDKRFSNLKENLLKVKDYGHDNNIFKEKKFRNFVDDQLFHFSEYENKLNDLDTVISKVLNLISDQSKTK